MTTFDKAQLDQQIARVDYEETYTLTAQLQNLKILLSMVDEQNLLAEQMDVKTVLLHAELQIHILIESPKSVHAEANNVCKPEKSIYGLKQSTKCWNDAFNKRL